MKNDVSVFKVILLFITELIIFCISYMIGYYIIMFIFNLLMNFNLFNAIFSRNIPYILFTLVESATIGYYSAFVTFAFVNTISKNQNNIYRSCIGSGIVIFIFGIYAFISLFIQQHLSFDVSFLIGGFLMFAFGMGTKKSLEKEEIMSILNNK